MYVMLDNTISTYVSPHIPSAPEKRILTLHYRMGDLLGFEGYLNESTPFKEDEYPVVWKSERRYHDFEMGTSYNDTCTPFPRLWNETGFPVDQSVMHSFSGCYSGEFDQFGDTEAFGVYPDYRRQLTKFASVQDRLREWVPSVREKLGHFTCLTIAMLDVDAFRYDKATQATLDATGNFSAQVRDCARALGKNNFFLPGEITGGNTFGALYVGRGKQPDMWLTNLTQAAALDNVTAARDAVPFLRDNGQTALDAAAFHYSIYRFLTRFLGMDGNLAAGYDLPPNWVDAWNQMLLSNDFLNADTHLLDPRHMYGATNQDVFRWPAIRQGTERMLLGMFITTLHMPGIPLLLWGEEQGFSILDSTADNYIYGRQAMTGSPAWQAHGCYAMDSAQYFDFPLDKGAREACRDEKQSWDHRDPAHPVRNIVKVMNYLRQAFPVLNDGLFLQQLSNMTKVIQYPGSSGVGTETGLFSVLRSAYPGVQDLGATTPIWLVYHNGNATETKYEFDCSSTSGGAIIAPFPSGTTVKNLFFPHDEIALKDSAVKLGINGSTRYNGCTDTVVLKPFEFRAYVPVSWFAPPPAMITQFRPGHDAHVDSAKLEQKGQVRVEFRTSAAMDCDSFTRAIEINSITGSSSSSSTSVNVSSVVCSVVSDPETPPYIGAVGSAWTWSADLVSVEDGVHEIVVRNATTADKGSFTNSVDKFLIRVGERSNPIMFPRSGNYSDALLSLSPENSGRLALTHSAPGASKWRYSLTWGSTWSEWLPYEQGQQPVPIERQAWTGTAAQAWDGDHVIVQYWSRLLSSSAFIQHGDLSLSSSEQTTTTTASQTSSISKRRFPHLYANGRFNQWGFDAGVDNELALVGEGQWEYHFAAEWPSTLQLNVWGINPDGQPDRSFVYGDIDNDFVLDRLPPSSLVDSVINITAGPKFPGLAYKLRLDDGSLRYELVPVGSAWEQLVLYILLWVGPLIGGIASVLLFKGSFYKVKFVKMGLSGNSTAFARWCKRVLKKAFPEFMKQRMAKTLTVQRGGGGPVYNHDGVHADSSMILTSRVPSSSGQTMVEPVPPPPSPPRRRTVLIATMEYNIDDWDIKIKIGGLGVMAGLMGKSLQHQDLVWVVPCVSGIEYPIDTPAEPMNVTILGEQYEVSVQYHKLGNITFVLLDSPVFRQQTKENPYPPRMDDLESAVYYSAWNQCIALTTRRFPIDLMHVNDYHGAAAMLYLLPQTIPTCLSLHNAEFQGQWPMKTADESREVAGVFNLDLGVVDRYVRFGSVFNLLHAGASYLRIHQRGFGAVGVSKKYGDRSFARYAIFWGLDGVGQLPNPDPTDIAEWNKEAFMEDRSVVIDPDYEAGRADLKRQAQQWAGLDVNPKADLFVFVGRWSLQKGVDLIADIFPSILEQYSDVQLICIGPVIDLYGKFAALKLAKMMDKYPGRVYSKPEFTALPPFIFSGAEFALIPSRDEPFGLVAVEFGRKGALGVGARVGGLGQMPGWWYTIESTSASHLLAQFREAIVTALETKHKTRAKMRAWSAKQRFPVAQWLEDLDILQSTAIEIHGTRIVNSGVSGMTLMERLKIGMRKILPKLKSSASSRHGDDSATRATPLETLPRDNDNQREGRSERRTASGAPSCAGTPEVSADDETHVQEAPRVVPPRPNTVKARMFDLSPPSSPTTQRSCSPTSGHSSRDSSVGAGHAKRHSLKAASSSFSAPCKTPSASSRHSQGAVVSADNSAAPSLARGQPRLSALRDSYFTEASSTSSATDNHLLAPPSFPFAIETPSPGFEPPSSLSRPVSTLSLQDVIGTRTDFQLQNVSPFFTDATGDYYGAFSQRLDGLTSSNSATDLCIEEFLVKSEKEWFSRYRSAKLGRLHHHHHHSGPSSRASSRPVSRGYRAAPDPGGVLGGPFDGPSAESRPVSSTRTLNMTLGAMVKTMPRTWLSKSQSASVMSGKEGHDEITIKEREYDPREFGIGDDYKPPTGLQK